MAETKAIPCQCCGKKDKIRTSFAKICVGGTLEKPYYNILYINPADQVYHVGFGSFCLEYVFKWLAEEFEIIPISETGGKWIPVAEKKPVAYVSVLGYMTDAEPFPPVRECYTVGTDSNAFYFPALGEFHPVSHWQPMPEPPEGANHEKD